VLIRSISNSSVSNTDRDINKPVNLTHNCCEMTVNTLPLGKIQLEIPVKTFRPMLGNCFWQTARLKMFRNLLMNKSGSLYTQQKGVVFVVRV